MKRLRESAPRKLWSHGGNVNSYDSFTMQVVRLCKQVFPSNSYTLQGAGIWFKRERDLRSVETQQRLLCEAQEKRNRKADKRLIDAGWGDSQRLGAAAKRAAKIKMYGGARA